MYRIGITMMFLFSSLSLFAETHEGINPVLRYDSHAHEHSLNAHSQYLRFVEEDVSFPVEGPQKEKFEEALALMETVMNSEEFKAKVIGYVNSSGERTYNKNFLWNESDKRLTNEDVYQIIMNGNEKMRPDTDGEMNFNSWVKKCSGLENLGIWCRKVIGSTTPHTDHMIKLNWNFYKKFETHQMVANMVHEWIHLLGFLHGNSNLSEEVPYVVGAIAGEVAKDLLARK